MPLVPPDALSTLVVRRVAAGASFTTVHDESSAPVLPARRPRRGARRARPGPPRRGHRAVGRRRASSRRCRERGPARAGRRRSVGDGHLGCRRMRPGRAEDGLTGIAHSGQALGWRARHPALAERIRHHRHAGLDRRTGRLTALFSRSRSSRLRRPRQDAGGEAFAVYALAGIGVLTRAVPQAPGRRDQPSGGCEIFSTLPSSPCASSMKFSR